MPRVADLAPEKRGFKIPDARLRMDQTFMRKPNIKAADVELELTPEQETEYLRCSLDAEYFARNYYKITSVDRGFILFDMYDYQAELFRSFQKNRFNVSLQARQSGKCTKYDTLIKVRDKLGNITEIKIGEFFHQVAKVSGEWIVVGDGTDGTDGKLSSYTNRKFHSSYRLSDYDVWTNSGFKPIKSVHQTKEYAVWHIETESGKALECADDHIVLKPSSKDPIQKYTKNLRVGQRVMTEDGAESVVRVLNMGYSEHMYDIQVESEDHLYYTNGILSHNTTVVAAFLLWYAMFHPDKEIAILANKEKQAKEILKRVNKAYMDMPFFLQRGARKFGSLEVEFDNGSSLRAFATTADSIRGNSIALLYVDEVAFIENDMEFWESTLPTISSGEDTKVIMTSTPKGERGLFYKIWREAEPDEKGVTNGFARTSVTWRDVPHYAKRKGWEESERRRIGDARFDQEYACSFKGSSLTLISSKYLEQMLSLRPIDDLSDYMKVFRRYEENRRYVGVADVGGGCEQDYSVLTIFDVTEYPYRIAAKFRNNQISPLMFPHTIISVCEQYGKCPVLVETNNDVGGQAITVLWYEMEYENTIMTSTDQKRAGSGTRIGGRMGKPGIKTTTRVRNIGCSNLKVLIEKGLLVIEDLDTIDELGTFVLNGERYEADKGCHDDCVMTLVLFSWMVKQDWFVDTFENNVGQRLMDTASAQSMAEMIPFGGINRSNKQTVNINEEIGAIPVTTGGTIDAWFNHR